MPRLGLYSSGWSAPGAVQFGASDFWRLAVPGLELARNGWEVVPATEIRQLTSGEMVLVGEAGEVVEGIDVILWQRWMGEGAAEAIRRARAYGQVIINDVDDMYWALPESNIAKANTDARRNPRYNREHYKDVIKASSMITVSTPYLACALERWGPPVRVVHNYISLGQWPLKPPGEYIGWVGVIGWRGADLQILQQGVVPWLRDRGLPFYHGGKQKDEPRSAADLLQYENVVTRPARDIPRYPSLWDKLGIALVPIEPSTFGLSKSWVKGLEACARGIPFIASDHPAYREMGAPRLAKKPRDWQRHLDELQDPDVYAMECAANRSLAEALSIERNWHAWDEVLRELL